MLLHSSATLVAQKQYQINLLLKLILIIVHKNRLLTIITAALYPHPHNPHHVPRRPRVRTRALNVIRDQWKPSCW